MLQVCSSMLSKATRSSNSPEEFGHDVVLQQGVHQHSRIHPLLARDHVQRLQDDAVPTSDGKHSCMWGSGSRLIDTRTIQEHSTTKDTSGTCQVILLVAATQHPVCVEVVALLGTGRWGLPCALSEGQNLSIGTNKRCRAGSCVVAAPAVRRCGNLKHPSAWME